MSLKTVFLEKKFKGLDKLCLIFLLSMLQFGLTEYLVQFSDYLGA